jgi:hypothetical protein
MGWKRVKEYYRVHHIVHAVGDRILIGSITDPCIIEIGALGVVSSGRHLLNSELARCFREMEEDGERLCELIAEQDEFARNLPVFCHVDGTIVEKFCEDHGFPNVTHDGRLMYEGLFFADRDGAVANARSEAQRAVASTRACIAVAEAELARLRIQLADREARYEAWMTKET